MRYLWVVFITGLLLCLVLPAYSSDDPIFRVKISNLTKEQLSTLARSDLDIAKVVDKNTVYAYVSNEEWGALLAEGYPVEKVRDRSKEYADSLWAATRNTSNPLLEYHTYNELTAELGQFAREYPDICLVESAGKSGYCNDLWIVKISDNVNIEEAEPEFKYISTMHGDEPVGMEMCLYLIETLLRNYGTDPRITNIVNETEIWIMPLMNPDGYIARTRRNGFNVNLNRDFPDRIKDPNNTTTDRQPETQAVMNLGFHHSFVLSANFHSGALVVNYPYDSNESYENVYTACPDDSLFIELAKTYASHNLPMWNSSSFPNGITNGAEWAVLYGGMQDWNYVWMGCNEVTIELSDVPWPPPDQLQSLWDDNRESMLSYIEAVHWGVRGIISDTLSGAPLAATVDVVGIDHSVYSDPDVGDYYRMLLPGEYTLRFSSENYTPKEIGPVLVEASQPTVLDVQLCSVQMVSVTGKVTDSQSGLPLHAFIRFIGDTAFEAESDSQTGTFKTKVLIGPYQVEVTKDGYVTRIDSIEISQSSNFEYELQPYVYIADWNFEDNDSGLSPSDTVWQWGQPTVGPMNAYSGQNVWGTCLSANYPNNVDARLTFPPIDLPDADHLEFSFWHWMDAETSAVSPGVAFDGGIVEVSLDDGLSWIQIAPVKGYLHTIFSSATSGPFAPDTPVFSGQHGWMEEIFDLGDYRGLNLLMRFRFGSNSSDAQGHAGWYIDDAAITYYGAVSAVSDRNRDKVPAEFWLSPNYPNPFNAETTIEFYLPKRSFASLRIYNVRGQLVKTLLTGKFTPGLHRVVFNAEGLPSGLYFCSLVAGSMHSVRKMILLE